MPSSIRPNRIRSVLSKGEAALGFGVLTCSPAVIEVAGRAGIDFVWLDLEHSGVSPYDSSSLENVVRAAENAQLAVVVRPPSGDGSMIGKVLDTGVHSVLVPGLASSKQVEEIVTASKYNIGGSTRGAGLTRAGGWTAPDAAFAGDSDTQVMVGIMIESKEAVNDIDNILSVKGLDYVFIGPVDLSVSLGVPFETTHHLVTESIARVRESALDRDVPVGITASDSESARKAIAEGFRIIRIGVDLTMISKSLSSLMEAVRK